MSTTQERRNIWGHAYLVQAQSDWRMFHRMAQMPGVEDCHRLHYLQMACEKLAKAYRFRDTDTDTAALLSSHVGYANISLLRTRSGRTFLKWIHVAFDRFDDIKLA